MWNSYKRTCKNARFGRDIVVVRIQLRDLEVLVVVRGIEEIGCLSSFSFRLSE